MAGFCKYCGRSLQDGEICQCRNNGMAAGEINEPKIVAEVKTPKAAGIVNIVAGAIMLLIGMADIEFDWGVIALLGGIGFLISGILELVKRNYKIIGIIQMVFGGLTALFGFICDLEYDWGYIGILIGITFFIAGLLRMLRKSVKAISVLEIVFAGILLLFAFVDIEFDWGVTALVASIGFMVSGILFLVYNKKKPAA